MVNFPVLYTGRGTSKPLQDTGGSFDDYARKYLGAQQMKLEKRMADEEWLSGMMTDPVQLMSTASMERQGALLEAYNDSFTDKLTKTDDNLTWQDKVEVNNARTSLQRAQMKMKAAEERAIKDYEIVQNDHKGIYDKQAAAERFQTYMKTGEYDASPLEVNPLNAEVFFTNIGKTVTGKPTAYDKDWNQLDLEDLLETPHYEYKTDLDGAKAKFWSEIEGDVGEHGRLLKDIRQQFNSLPENVKFNYLDADGDGTVSEEERRAQGMDMGLRANPIMVWAEEHYSRKILEGGSEFQKGWKPSTGKQGGEPFRTNLGGADYKYMPPTPKEQNYGEMKFETYYEYPRTNANNVSFDNAVVIDNERKRVRSKSIAFNINAKLVGYDRQTDKLIFKSNQRVGSEYSPDVDRNDIIVVDRSSMGTQYDELYVDDGGQMVKIGDLKDKGTMDEATTFDPTNF